jgi:hypothetical protein
MGEKRMKANVRSFMMVDRHALVTTRTFALYCLRVNTVLCEEHFVSRHWT